MDLLAILSIMAVVLGSLFWLFSFGGRGLRGLAKATPTTKIADAEGHGRVEIAGTFRRAEGEAARRAPFSGKPALWWHVEIRTSNASNNSTTYTTHYEETSGEPLWIDDGSGEMARVDPRGARLEVSEETLRNAPTDAQSFCQLHDVPWKADYLFYEQAICEGDPAYALGLSRREAGGPRPDAFRDAPTSHLVVFSVNLEEHPWEVVNQLILANTTEKSLMMGWGVGVFGSLFVIALGLVGGCIWAFCKAIE